MHIERLLLPIIGEQIDQEAATLATELVRPSHGRIYVLYVISVPWEYPVDAELPQETAKGERLLDHVEQLLKEKKCDVTAELLQARNVGTAVVTEAVDREVDLILMGMSFKRRHGIFYMGDEVPYVLESAPCPVLVMRESMPSEDSPHADIETMVSWRGT